MTTPEMMTEIDTRTRGTNRGSVTLRGLAEGVRASIAVRILRPRWLFGRIDVLVTPVAGTGNWWVDLDSLRGGEGEGGEE